MWQVITKEEFDTWFAQLEPDAQIEVIAKVELLKIFGPLLKRPHADTLKDSKHANMKELRADTARQNLRIAFAFDSFRCAILLIGSDKRGISQKRFYKRIIAQADKLLDRHLAELKNRRNGV